MNKGFMRKLLLYIRWMFDRSSLQKGSFDAYVYRMERREKIRRLNDSCNNYFSGNSRLIKGFGRTTLGGNHLELFL
jgi:hypothetical protein